MLSVQFPPKGMTSKWERTSQEERRPKHRPKASSFSSSLLDSIYHSLDKEQDYYPVPCKQNNAIQIEQEISSLRRAIKVEKWMENRSVSTRTPKPAAFTSRSTSSSSDSSFFSSSETECSNRSTPNPSFVALNRAKAIMGMEFETTPKREGRFMRTKLRALKMYGDLKKVKQPISPGGKITSFWNSLFNPKNLKMPKYVEAAENENSVRKSRSVDDISGTHLSNACFTRSCLSKKASSNRGVNSKRSVKFYPVSVIVDEDSRPCGHKCIYEHDPKTMCSLVHQVHPFYKDDPSLMPLPVGRKLVETAMGKQGKIHGDFLEVDDDESCASSDLFELDNIGIGSYFEELPVYGTTSLKTNHAIANGLIL